MSPRRTLTPNVARTAAATAARRRRHVQQLAERFVWTIPELSDEVLAAVVRVIAEELETRLPATDIRHPSVPNSATARRDGIAHASAESGHAVADFRSAEVGAEGTHTLRTLGGERVA